MPAAQRRIRIPDILLYGTWWGILTGLAEVGLLGVRKWVLGRYLHISPMVVWMAPVADILLLLLPAVAVGLAARWGRRNLSFTHLTAGFAAFGMLSVLTMWGKLYIPAEIVLSIGVGVQVAGWLTRHQSRFRHLVQATLPGMVGLVLLGGGILHGSRLVRERRMEARLGPPPPAGTPNVLLIILDTVRSFSLSCYGQGRPTTPNIDRFSHRGVRFERAYTTAPWTLPSHVTMLTGAMPHETAANWVTPFDGSRTTLTESLAEQGFRTAGFVGNLWYLAREAGLSRGFVHYEDYRVTPGRMLAASAVVRRLATRAKIRNLLGYYEILGRIHGAGLSRRVERWIRRHPDRPFFAMVNYFDAHAPYLPPARFRGTFGDPGRRNPLLLYEPNVDSLAPHAVQRELDAYEEALRSLDEDVGWLLDSLEAQGILDNTVVIITADHGEEFAEHGELGHGGSLYLEVTQVPLIVIAPDRIPAGATPADPVSLVDLPATILDLLGLGTGEFPGRSLARAWTGEAGPGHPEAVMEEEEMLGAVLGRYHYLVRRDGNDELYDAVLDPVETRDLSDRQEFQGFMACLRSATANRLRSASSCIAPSAPGLARAAAADGGMDAFESGPGGSDTR